MTVTIMICMYGDSLHLSIHKPPVRAYFSHLDWNPNKAAWCNKNETKLWSCWFSVVNCVAVIVNHTGVCPFGSLRSGRAILLNTCTEVDHFSRESSNKIQREKQNLLLGMSSSSDGVHVLQPTNKNAAAKYFSFKPGKLFEIRNKNLHMKL